MVGRSTMAFIPCMVMIGKAVALGVGMTGSGSNGDLGHIGSKPVNFNQLLVRCEEYTRRAFSGLVRSRVGASKHALRLSGRLHIDAITAHLIMHKTSKLQGDACRSEWRSSMLHHEHCLHSNMLTFNTSGSKVLYASISRIRSLSPVHVQYSAQLLRRCHNIRQTSIPPSTGAE